MALTLWVCRDPEEWREDAEILFYRREGDARKKNHSLLRWYWSYDMTLFRLPVSEGVKLLRKAGLSLAPGEGPRKIKITIKEAK